MNNYEIAKIFAQVADLLEIKGEVVYKIRAYRNAAETIESWGEKLEVIAGNGNLTDLPGVGKAISEKIMELLETGKLNFLENLNGEYPLSLTELIRVPDLGPKKVKLIWQELGISSIEALKKAAEEGKLQNLPGMGAKSEQRILTGIASLSTHTNRHLLDQAIRMADLIKDRLLLVNGVSRVEAAGSLRRWKESVGDLDLLAAAEDSSAVMDVFTGHPLVSRIISQGRTKSSVEFMNGMRAQMWVHLPEKFGTALQYATGSAQHNVHLREVALKQGYSLSEQALKTADGTEILFTSEKELYEKLGMQFIPPELRENRGEIEAAVKGKLPALITREDVISDLHCHSDYSDGKDSIMEMAMSAIQAGRKILAITDHSVSLGIGNGISKEKWRRQKIELAAIQAELSGQIRLLHGIELEIRADGSLDYDNDFLAEMDIVVASLHVSMRQPEKKLTERMLTALNNPHVDIIAHPTNRYIIGRKPAGFDMDKVLETAAKTNTALEINANPRRLDLTDIYARKAGELGIPISINTDAHTPAHFDYMQLGVSVARRAWLTKEQVINTWSEEKLLNWLQNRD